MIVNIRKILILLSLFCAIIAIFGCKEPDYRRTQGLQGNNDILVFATDAPDSISLYSVRNARMEHTLPSDERLNDMAVDKEGKFAYVVTKNGWLNVFNLERGDRKDRVRIGDILQSVAISADGQYLAIGVGTEEDYNAHDISIRYTENIHKEKRRINVRGDIQDLVANPTIPELYVVNTKSDKIRIFNFDQEELEGILTLGGSPSVFAVTPDGMKAYATLNARSIINVIDLTTRTNLTRYDVMGAPHYVTFSADDSLVAVSDRDKNVIHFIDNRKNEMLGYKEFPAAIANVMQPETLAFSQNGQNLYVLSSKVRDLIVIDIRTMQMAQNHSLPKRPSVMHVIWRPADSGR